MNELIQRLQKSLRVTREALETHNEEVERYLLKKYQDTLSSIPTTDIRYYADYCLKDPKNHPISDYMKRVRYCWISTELDLLESQISHLKHGRIFDWVKKFEDQLEIISEDIRQITLSVYPPKEEETPYF